MNFGVRLPGPFRVGVSSHGRINAGVTMGPVSMSTGIGGRPARRGEQPFYPISVEDAVAELAAAGWTPTYADPQTAMVAKGWKAARIDAVQGGVTWEPITSRRALLAKTVFWVAFALGAAWLCAGLGR